MAMNLLSPMRYKEFVWPHNPRTYTIDYQRRMAVHPVPGGSCELEPLGQSYRMMQGEGEFTGPEAYRQFRALASVFYDNSPGLLVHPIWQAAKAYFVELSLVQEPRADYVRYRFAFWECPPGEETGLVEMAAAPVAGGGQAAPATPSQTSIYHTVVRGETLWGIARQYGITTETIIRLNPQIKNPNLIYAGQKVQVSP